VVALRKTSILLVDTRSATVRTKLSILGVKTSSLRSANRLERRKGESLVAANMLPVCSLEVDLRSLKRLQIKKSSRGKLIRLATLALKKLPFQSMHRRTRLKASQQFGC
jgi:hypothetical protein